MAKKRFVAFIDDTCSGCAGMPVCRIFCPTDGALEYVLDEASHHIKRMRVNPDKCIGCRSCASRGHLGAHTEGCPWNAVRMVPAEDGSP
jgi:NAD-dependent dihydropyrimidine dehydrogenase PreA subunit